MNPPCLTRKQSRRIDQIAIASYGIPGMVLMENAGRGVVEILLRIDPRLVEGKACRPVVNLLCGKGNNAGDGFVIARHLEIHGVAVQVLLLASPQELTGDAQSNYEILSNTDVSIVDLSEVADLASALNGKAADASWLIDAMLGTGAVGQPRQPYRTAIEWMNRARARRLAVDVPSGLDCDTGQPAEPTVRADVTCSFVASKVGFSCDSARDFLGDVHIVSIGTPPKLLAEVMGTL